MRAVCCWFVCEMGLEWEPISVAKWHEQWRQDGGSLDAKMRADLEGGEGRDL